ncbi:MAG: hypothetical protein JW863_17960 [Chitinispirillaceae bacterium]|nr:hypothetical protein [Chitinispirillaceae bacterium]
MTEIVTSAEEVISLSVAIACSCQVPRAGRSGSLLWTSRSTFFLKKAAGEKNGGFPLRTGWNVFRFSL